MDEQSKATFDEIVAKEPAALSESDIAFLRARRSYLSSQQKEVFAEVLAEAQPAEAAPVEEAKTDEAEAPKKTKKAKTDEAES